MNVDTGEFRALSDEVAGLRTDMATLLRVAGIFYRAGHDDALHGPPLPQPPPKRPLRARRRHLKAVQ